MFDLSEIENDIYSASTSFIFKNSIQLKTKVVPKLTFKILPLERLHQHHLLTVHLIVGKLHTKIEKLTRQTTTMTTDKSALKKLRCHFAGGARNILNKLLWTRIIINFNSLCTHTIFISYNYTSEKMGWHNTKHKIWTCWYCSSLVVTVFFMQGQLRLSPLQTVHGL